MKDMTLVFLIKGEDILLVQKKRGFGQGRWNGAGGKVEKDETIEQALVRECEEEIGITPLTFEKVAELTFDVMMKGESTQLLVHTYLCSNWGGEPVETEEMKPQWFSQSQIPYSAMWQDDKFWLPQVLDGKKIKGVFDFAEHDAVVSHEVIEVDHFE